MISPLERATLAACTAFQGSEFGTALQARSPQARAKSNGPFADPLVMFEINGGAPIARTLNALHMLAMGSQPIDRSAIQEYVTWVGQAMLAVQRLAQMCWAPIPKRERQLICDDDDLGPAGSPYLPASRADEPGPSLKFEGLSDSAALTSWRDLVKVLRQTPCYQAAREAGEALTHPELRAEAIACSSATRTACNAVADPTASIGEVLDGQRAVIQDTYQQSSAELHRAATAIRAHSGLVNHLLWAVLCAAERDDLVGGVADLGQDDLGAMRLTGRRPQQISLVARDRLWIGHPPSPFLIDHDTPCAGLYIVCGSMMQFETTGLVDVHGTRLASLEQAPT